MRVEGGRIFVLPGIPAEIDELARDGTLVRSTPIGQVKAVEVADGYYFTLSSSDAI